MRLKENLYVRSTDEMLKSDSQDKSKSGLIVNTEGTGTKVETQMLADHQL